MTHARSDAAVLLFTILAAVPRLCLAGRDAVISEIQIDRRFTASGLLFVFAASVGIFLPASLPLAPRAQKSLSINVHKYLQQLIPTWKTKGPLRAQRGGEEEYEGETLVLSTPVKVRSSPSAQCQSCQALQTGSTDLLCSACTFQAGSAGCAKGSERTDSLFARLPLTFGSHLPSPWACGGPPEYTSQTQVKLSVGKSQRETIGGTINEDSCPEKHTSSVTAQLV